MPEVTRTDVLATMAEEWAPEIWKDVEKTSVALASFRNVPMGKKEKIIPFLDAFPATPSGGPFVNGDTGIKPTYSMAWANKTMQAEEIAGIVPIPENVLADAEEGLDVWGEIRAAINTYVARSIDAAVFAGVYAPASWPTGGLAGVATAAGNVLDLSTYLALGTQAQGFDRAGAYNELIGLVEDDGYSTDKLFAKKSERRILRNLRDADGNPILSTAPVASGQSVPTIWDVPTNFLDNGILPSDVHAIAADPRYALIGRRSDMEWKMLDQATLTQMVTIGSDQVRAVAVSMAEQDMVGLRFKIRLGFSYMDPTTWEGGQGASPFAVLVP